MIQYVTGKTAKLIDEYSIEELGIPSLQLMESASEAVADRAVEFALEYGVEKYGKKGVKSIKIIACCGVGNNGADGICALSILKAKGFENLEAVYVGNLEKESHEFEYQRKRLQKNGIALQHFNGSLPKADLILDAVFGIGLKRKVEGEYLQLINEINRLKLKNKSYVISVDIPSGINSDNGFNLCGPEDAVAADETVSFGYAKMGHVLDRGPVYTGKLRVADIGYPLFSDEEFDIYNSSDYGIKNISAKLMERDRLANKGSYKKLLIVAGSKGMAGAAYLSGYAAFKSGIGMVRYLGPEDNRLVLQTLLPEAMYDSLDMEAIKSQLKASVKWADCITLGPGLSQSEEAFELVSAFCDEDIRAELKDKCFVIDADALNIIALHPELKKIYTEETIITPHIGEFARLTGKTIAEVREDRLSLLTDYAVSNKISVVLKDNVSLVAVYDRAKDDVDIYVNTSGSAALSKAGSGDVLTGAIQGLLAVINEGMSREIAGKSYAEHLMNAVYIFGKAGKLAGDKFEEHGSLARDVAKQLPFAMAKYKK